MPQRVVVGIRRAGLALRLVLTSWSYPTMPWDFLLIFFLLAVVVPWRGWARLQRLLALPSVTSHDRVQLYLTSIAAQWAITIVILWRAFARGLSLAELGLRFTPLFELLAVGVGGAALFGVAHWFNLRRVGRSDNPAVERIRSLGARIFPKTNREVVLFAALSLTAGLCEEFLYRGFVFGALAQVHVPVGATLLISSVMFGLAHAYQGRGGMIATLLLGTVFGTARILYHSLVPVVLWHAAVDIAAGLAGRRYLIKIK
jgi:membrane protease YdiL (CAAX protease family)